MFALLLSVAVAATPQREPIAIAAPDLSVVNLDENRASFYTEYFAQELTRAGLRVVTAKQISAVLGMERQRQLLNCSEGSSSCMAELANALGTDGILIGTIAQIGKVFQVNLSIVGSRDGATLSVRSVRVNKEEDLLDALAKAAPPMAREVTAVLRPGEVKAAEQPAQAAEQGVAVGAKDPTVERTAVPERRHALRAWSWAPAVGALALGVGGGVLWAASDANYQRLTAPPGGTISTPDARRAMQDGELQQSLAVGAFVAGGVALAAAGTMFFLPTSEAPSSAPAVGVSLTSTGGTVVLTGSWP